jgi:SAM-dependent methyltransferase
MTDARDNAALYDAVHAGTPGDVEHYLRLAEGASSVLELGCGSGRVLVALAAAGLDASGIEIDRGMLEAARDRAAREGVRVTLIEADMASFELERRFDRIIVPFTGLCCLLTPERLEACLRSARAHLAPGGLFAFDVYVADDFHDQTRPEDYPDDLLEPVAEIIHDGEALRVLEKSRWDRDRQRVDATYVYVGPDGNVRHVHTIGHRYLRRHEVEPLLARAGLSIVSLHGDFSGGPYDPSGGSLVVVARGAR